MPLAVPAFVGKPVNVEAASPSTDLFVYGTLRQSAFHPGHPLLFPADFLSPARVRGRLYDLGAYPGAVFTDGAGCEIHGEVYRLRDPPAILARLDAYEGCTDADPAPHEYRRVQISVRLEAGEVLSAWAYEYHRAVDELPLISSGDWLLRREPPNGSSSGDASGKPPRPASSTAV